MEKFYFTFGCDEKQIHDGGLIVIEANNYYEAREKFVEKYGIDKDGCLPFAFQYTEEQFKQTSMYKRGKNFNHGEWGNSITLDNYESVFDAVSDKTFKE